VTQRPTRHHFPKRTCTLGAVLLVATGLLMLHAWTRAQDPPARVPVEKAKKTVEKLLKDPALPPGLQMVGQPPSLNGGEYVFRVHGEAQDHECRANLEGHVNVRVSDGAVVALSIQIHRAWYPERVLTERAARSRAERFLGSQYPSISTGDALEGRLLGPIDPQTGVYRFYFVKREGAFLTPCTADVHVTAYSGEVVRYVRRDDKYAIPPRVLTEEEAVATAQDSLERSANAGNEKWRLAQAQLTFYSRTREEKGIPAWSLRFVADGVGSASHRPTDGQLQAWVYIEATNGELLDLMIERAPPDAVDTNPGDDGWPVWINGHEIAFASGRPRAGHPRWRPRNEALFLVELARGKLFSLVQAFDDSCYRPTVAKRGGAIICESKGLVGISLATGEVIRFTSWERRGSTPFAGEEVVVFSSDRRHGDEDIFAANLSYAPLAMSNQRRLCRLDGQDVCPVISADGCSVFFGHHDENTSRDRPWEVWRVRANGPYWQNTPPEAVARGFGKIRRLCLFQEKRILVWHAHGMDVVDATTGAVHALQLPELHDPDLPDGPPLKMREPGVSPDGTRLAFSGYRDSGDPEKGTGWYIYICDLDGSDLRRVTPLGDEPVPPYVFPETGKTAFDVAKEIALKRMEQEN